MNIAELFVRVRGDTSDVTRQLKGVEGGMRSLELSAGRLDGGMQKAHFSTGKLRQELLTLTRQVTNTSPIVTQLGGLLTDFAVGGTVGLAVIGGIGAIALAYEKLTKATREATAENNKLIESFRESMKLKALGPGGREQMVQSAAETQLAAERRKLALLQADLNSISSDNILRPVKEKQYTNTLAEIRRLQTDIANAEAEIFDARVKASKPLDTMVIRASKGAEAIRAMAEESKRLNAALVEAGRASQWIDDFAPKIADAITQRGQEFDSALSGTIGTLNTVTPDDIKETVKPTVDGIKAPILSVGDKITNAVKENGVQIAGMLGSIASALLIGGGGRGSQIGSSLGGGLGSVAGSAFGPYGSVIGGVLGGLAGSLVGGMFDKPANNAAESLNRLTDAARDATASILNLPSGVRIERYRYNASIPIPRGGGPPPPDGGGGTSGGGGGGRPRETPTIMFQGDLIVQANSVEEIGRQVQKRAARGGVSRLDYALVPG